jgi:hypothetical protein
VSLTGPGGLLARLTKVVLESASEGEMDAHLIVSAACIFSCSARLWWCLGCSTVWVFAHFGMRCCGARGQWR